MGEVITSKIIIPSGDPDVPEMNYTLIIVTSVGGIIVILVMVAIVGVIRGLKVRFKR